MQHFHYLEFFLKYKDPALPAASPITKYTKKLTISVIELVNWVVSSVAFGLAGGNNADKKIYALMIPPI